MAARCIRCPRPRAKGSTWYCEAHENGYQRGRRLSAMTKEDRRLAKERKAQEAKAKKEKKRIRPDLRRVAEYLEKNKD